MSNNTETISPLSVYDIFNKGGKYSIPLYQRAFAWGDNEIRQLIEDIEGVKKGENYYLGSLIVDKKEDDNFYSVIDGQQRLTTLYLMMCYLKKKLNKNEFEIQDDVLTFEGREKSIKILKFLREHGDKGLKDLTPPDDLDGNLINGFKIVDAYFKEKSIEEQEEFYNSLNKIKIFRIQVPSDTDLNHYFEIMNTRGEQLRQEDILKARLMETLDDKDKAAFALIWDACADMSGYVQMHFDTTVREHLFGSNWSNVPQHDLKLESIANKLNEVKNKPVSDNEYSYKPQSILDILKPEKTDAPASAGNNENNDDVRFDSIIDFPHLLLHALKIKIWEENNNDNKDDNSDKGGLDDKKLLDLFGDKPAKTFAEEFIIRLLKCRFLFDTYIIKREYKKENKNNDDGEWRLFALKSYEDKKNKSKKPSYVNPFVIDNNENTDRNILMLQACLRVSYTSPSAMHWITETLKYLNEMQKETLAPHLEERLKKIIHRPVKEFIDGGDDNRDKKGVGTPHIVLNYLDYLLWEEKNDSSFDFEFEFRNSVEHFYPQNPTDGWEKWGEVDCFGNLCLLSRQQNSRFSNLNPKAKKDQFGDTIKKGSLKLREMADLIEEKMALSDVQDKLKEHGKTMWGKLENAVNQSPEETQPQS